MDNNRRKQEIVSYDEQIEQGLIRKQRQTFVAPLQGEVLPPARPAAPPASTESITRFDVAPSATSNVEVKTSAVDRARGFVIATRELGIVFGVTSVVVAWLFADVPILSLPTLAIFLLVYASTWGFAYYQTLAHSAEAAPLKEANRKLDIIEFDVRKRWEAYEREQRQMLQERTEDRQEARQRRLGGK